MARGKSSSKSSGGGKSSGGRKSSGGGSYRSAVSGRYVTSKHGKANPRTTVKESK